MQPLEKDFIIEVLKLHSILYEEANIHISRVSLKKLNQKFRSKVNQQYKKLMRAPVAEYVSEDCIYDTLLDYEYKIADELDFLRTLVIHGELINIYHLWEKKVKEYIQYFKYPQKSVDEMKFNDILEYFPNINDDIATKMKIMSLCVGFYKHGKGRSFNKLAQHKKFFVLNDEYIPTSTTYDLSEEKFKLLSQNIDAFWNALISK